jgi:MFS family permease
MHATSSPARPVNPFRVLADHRNFRLFWLGQTGSLIGTWMQQMGQGWLALQLTNSAFMVGLTAACAALPVLLLSLYGGVVADRRDKLRLVVVAQSLLLVQATVLWWFVWSGHITIWLLILLSLANGAISAFEVPARQSLIIELVSREDLPNAIALNSGGFNLARVVGPSLAGLVIHSLGVAWCFGLNAVSYLAVLAGLFLVRLPARVQPVSGESPLSELREGLGYISGTPEVSLLMRLVFVYAVFGIPFLALMPVLARDVLQSGASGYGMLLAAVGTGGLLGALALAALGQHARRGRLLVWSALTYSLLLIVFSFSRSLSFSVALMVLVGVAMITTNALANSLLQRVVPDRLRGRVMAAYVWVFVGWGPVLGPFLAGSAAAHIGAAGAVGLGAAITLIYSLRAFVAHPELTAL